MKIYAIGDIHGKFDKLKGLIEQLDLHNHLLIFLGDYIDRGEDSFKVVDCLTNLDRLYNCVFLKGNHEELFMDYLSGVDEYLFINNGGNKTVSSYMNGGYDITLETCYEDRHLPSDHLNFYRGLKYYYETDKYIFVHAGLLPKDVPLSEQPKEILLWERYDFINSEFNWGKKVIFGHTPNKEVLNMYNKICIDTGACYGDGALTCVELPGERFIQQK